MASRNIRLRLSYDGTDFAGWQIQAKDRSVQGVLQEVLSELLDEKTVLTGAGRTDAGVHAIGQVANFFTENRSIPAERFREALNGKLPMDIRVLESAEVGEKFHSRRDARLRHYGYYLVDGPVGPAHVSRYSWVVRPRPPVRLLDAMASVLPGTHDFATFAAAGDVSESKVRRVEHAVFRREGPFTVFRIAGNAFLWRMVRSLVGTMVDLAVKKRSPDALAKVLESRDRFAAGPTAPPQGLFLEKVIYE